MNDLTPASTPDARPSDTGDIVRKLSRRQALGIFGVTGTALTLIRCGGSPTSPSTTGSTTGTGSTAGSVTTPVTTAGCAVSPTETIGPYPSLIKFVRSDIREGRAGLPVTLTITVVNTNASCSPVSNALVDVWQCDAAGHYSEYNQAGYNGTAETFLRGMQTTDASGRVTFTTVYPGWYAGRATHIHVEVSINGRSVKVTQIAFPESVTAAVYASGVYTSRGQNPTSNAADMVFADGVSSELASVSGDPASGITATFTVGIAV